MFGKRPPIDRHSCFVLMPFASELRPVYDAIRETVEREHNLSCRRADDIYSDGVIIHEIWEHICSAHLIVADATGRNANVLYEVGLAHALSKPVVVLAQDLADLPFDIRHRRVIVYDRNHLATLRGPLSRTVAELKWHSPQIHAWLETDRDDVRIGLETPVPGAMCHDSPIAARGRVVGIPEDGLEYSVQAFVETNKVYEQSIGVLDVRGYWWIDQIHLGAQKHSLFFRLFDEAGRLVATSERMLISKNVRV